MGLNPRNIYLEVVQEAEVLQVFGRYVKIENMRLWVINATWSEGSEEQTGLLSVMVSPDEQARLTKLGLLVFDTEEDAQRFVDERHLGSGYEPAPLKHGSIVRTVDSEGEGTPDCILYLGPYQKGDRLGTPISASQFLTAIDEG